MKTLTTFTSFLLFSSFISHSLSRPIIQNSASASPTSAAATAGDLEEDWFHHHHHFFAHSPRPSWHKKRWPFVHPPMHHGGFKWDHPHALPPMPEKPWPHKEWPSADAPMPHGWKRHHHWPIMHPWWPKKGYEVADVAADEIEAAAPPLAA